MSVRFCIFDVGGVCYPYSLTPLNDYLRTQTEDVSFFNAKNGAKSYDYKPFMLGKMSYKNFCKDLCQHCKVHNNSKVRIHINRALHEGVGHFFPETMDLMKNLRRKGVNVCLLSNALPNLENTASHLTFPKFTFTSFELGLLKPDPKIYETVLERLNARPQEVIFIDDKETNVKAAQKLGIHGIVFERETISEKVKQILLSERIPHLQKDLSNSF